MGIGKEEILNKIKGLVPKAVPARFATVSRFVKSKYAVLDKKQFIYGMTAVVLTYTMIFAYVYVNADYTINKIESKMASVTAEMSQKKPAPSAAQINANMLADAKLVDGLYKYDYQSGRLPIIRKKDHLTSFRAYQMPYSWKGVSNKKVVSFMFKDYGLSEKESEIALDILPSEVSFLVSPYASLPQEWINRARERGHEVWLELPIQNDTDTDQGLNTIYHHESLIDKALSMRASLARGLGYVGVGIFTDESTKETENHYIKIAEEIYGRGLGILELNPESPNFIEIVAVTSVSPYFRADDVILKSTGDHSLKSIEDIVNSKHEAVVIIPAYPTVIKNVALWIEKIGKVDYAISPVSALYDLSAEQSYEHSNIENEKVITPSSLNANDHAEPIDNKHKN